MGRIHAEKLKANGGGMMRFQTPDDRLAVVARLDSVQHRFLKELNGWANATRGFDFGTLLGRHNLIVLVKDVGPQPFDDSDPEQVTIICKDAIDKFGSDFLDAVKADMLMIGYQIDDLALKRPDNIRPALPGDLLGIAVKEGTFSAQRTSRGCHKECFAPCRS